MAEQNQRVGNVERAAVIKVRSVVANRRGAPQEQEAKQVKRVSNVRHAAAVVITTAEAVSSGRTLDEIAGRALTLENTTTGVTVRFRLNVSVPGRTAGTRRFRTRRAVTLIRTTRVLAIHLRRDVAAPVEL